jgi:DNA processing protein
VRGDLGALLAPSVAVVGARAATLYGRSVARELAAGLAAAGAVVVSGLARGIDAEAHRGALDAGGRTVAVLPCGPDLLYPPEHRGLAEAISARGAVVTELPLGTRPRRPLFALRNRLISGLARAVVVVEARRRSGSLITARHAADQGADVFAVPGPITAPTSEGPNRLLRDGAGVVLEARDVLEPLGLAAAPARSQAATGEPGRAALREICALLRRAPLTRDELCRRLARAPEDLAPDLLELELEGRVAEDRDGRLRVLR